MKSKYKIVIVSFILFFSLVQNVQAVQLVICGRHPVQGDTQGTQPCTPDQLVNQIVSLVNFLIDSATVLAIGYVLYGGISMILSRGNAANFQSARSTMSNAIQGLIIVLMAYLIVSFIIVFLTGGKTFDQIFNFVPHQ